MPGLYDRQAQLNLTIPRSVTIVGCGGIGSWVAIDSAMSGIPNLYLYDPDIMEESNRNRLPFCQASLNRPKVDVVADFIHAIRPEAVIAAIPEKLAGVFLQIQLSVSDYFIDCTDSPRSQLAIYNACKAKQINYIRAGYDGTSMTITSHISGWIRADAEEEHYAVNPSWVVPAQIVAALAVGKMMKYYNHEVACDVGDIGIAVLQRSERLTPRCHQAGRETRYANTAGTQTGRIRTGR